MNPDPIVLAPVYVVVLLSTFFAIIFGIIFKDMLEYRLEVWRTDDNEQVHYKTPQIKLSYAATCLFSAICMGSSITSFGFPIAIAYATGIVIVGLTGLLMWFQLGSMLKLLAQSGSAAFDLE